MDREAQDRSQALFCLGLQDPAYIDRRTLAPPTRIKQWLQEENLCGLNNI